MSEKKINATTLRVTKGDITQLDVDAFVYYAQEDLKLGTGFGGAIAVRGGPTIQEELDKIGKLPTGEVAVTGAGELKAAHIIHAVGPRFQETDVPGKLRATMASALRAAEQRGARRLAFPAMGCGFYGVPLDLSAAVMLETLQEHVKGGSGLQEVIICVVDNRELAPFARRLEALA
jgi:O-acetyl-ADP-ribose deacetylase (regulator of RNase III)